MSEKRAKSRIRSLDVNASLNAAKHREDGATASMDLLCAFVLSVKERGGNPERARDAAWKHAVDAVNAFWPDKPVN